NVGSHSITFTVSDGNGGTDSEVVQITVAESSSSNSGPILASVGSKSVVAGSSLSIILSASDVDGDALSYSVSGNPAGSSLSGTTFSWTPESGDVGTHNVTFSVSDGNGGSDSEVVQITVEGVQNSNPVLASIGPQSVKTDGSTLTITLSATDSDGDVLTYTVSGNQSGSALSGSEFSYTPLALDTGTVPVTFTVSDGNGGSDSEVVQITVSVGNLAPVPQAINAVTSEDQATEIQLSATDPDGDAVYFLLSTQPSHGSASLSGDVLTYTPNPDYAGLDTVGYAATDSSLTSEIEFIVIDVTQVNDAPSLPSQVTEVNEDETLLLVLSVFDPDGDETSLRLVVAPDHGSVELGDNQIEYTPASEYSGPDSLQLAVSDGQIESSAWISINVLSVNDPPVFHAVTTEFAIEELDTLRIVLETSDPEEKVLGLRVVTAPVGLEMEFGIVTWVPDATQAGEYEIVFEVLDLKGGSSTITFSVEVANVNQPPTIEVESRLVFHEGESGGYVVKVNDVDDDPVTLNFEADNEGISIQDSVITWTPDFEAAGEWQATLTAGDGLAETIVQLRLVVVNVNRPPTADPVVPQSIDVGDTLRVEVVAEDPDGDLVVFELVESYAGLSMEENILTWVPVLDQRGDRELAVLLSDGEGGESTLVVVVSIKGKIPLAQFTADTQIGLAPLTVQFTDISVGRIDNWWWAFGDGGIGFEQHPTHVYSQPGVYSVDLRASNDDGVAYDTLEVTALEATIYIGSAPELAGPTPTLEVAANHYQSESVSIRASFTLDGVEWRPATVDPTRVEGSANVVWRFTEDVMERGEYDVRIAFQPEVELGLSDTVAFHVSTVGPSIVEVTGDYGGLEMRVLFDREVVIGDGTQFELEGLDVEEVIQEAPDVIRLRLSTPLPEGELTLTAREVLDELDGSGGGRFSFVPMNSPPSVRIAEVEQAEAGEWNFSVAIEDVQSNSVQLSVEYQIGNDWISIDLGGPFEPGEHSLTWIPTGDVLGYQGDLLVRMWGTDIEMGEVVSIEVVVDLNDAPLLSSLTIPEPLSRLVEVEFEGSDSEADSIHVVFEYAVGSEWFQVDPDDISVNRQGDGFSGVISWDTFAEFGYGEFPSVAIQLSAADLDTTFLDTVVTIRNLAGDYDGDGQISAPDLAVFTSHWLDESADADLGPATGDLPLLIPEGDGLLNFEDLLVVAQMWNWSIGIIPQGVVGKSTGNENLAFTELTTQEGRLRVVVDPYGALSADVTIRLHGEDVEVVSPQSFVMKRRSEGLLEVFVGALDGAPSPFSVTIEDPTTVHGVTRIWNTDGTLRTTESWSYTPPQPQATSLTGSWPNPFNSSTTIGLEVSDESFLTLNVYDVLGRRVRSLLSDMLPAGVHQVVWDGRDDEGLSVGSGIYIVRMVADDVMSLQRVLLLK
ncbi:MAG: tandem-95 repeat protein, partial [Candidatus Latescibacteria bacterium]|nr:tandem-95 repeat protein [Candidatus Latescibacterota bacterium]